MLLKEFQTYKCSHFTQVPFSIVWSEDNMIAQACENTIYVSGRSRNRMGLKYQSCAVFLVFLLLLNYSSANNITSQVFGSLTEGIPAAFGDFNSDEYPDLFIIRNNQKTVEILLGSDIEPFFKTNNLKCDFDGYVVTSVVPGDFNGDALMDVLVTVTKNIESEINSVRILWGSLSNLNCSSSKKEVIKMKGQPLAMDRNQDMIIDLFGVSEDGFRTFWIFSKDNPPVEERMKSGNNPLSVPHSHAFLDLNGDSAADLFVTTKFTFETWLWDNLSQSFNYASEVAWPVDEKHTGQVLFLDVELKGVMDYLLPVCYSKDCSNSSLLAYSNDKWHDLKVNFNNGTKTWGFCPPDSGSSLFNTITLRAGDFNMDGYPDILVTLKNENHYSSFWLRNSECVNNCDTFSRTFIVEWKALQPHNDNSILGVFYDFLQDGVLDIIFVHKSTSPRVSAFKNSLDYDANFVKVIVLTGLANKDQRLIPTPIGKKIRTYGSNFPGPKISYRTVSQESSRAAVSAQLPQSAYFSLHLPYTLFGLGRTPNFIDTLTVGINYQNRTWTQLIPNSQMVVIPWPKNHPELWTAQLFVRPSKLIRQTIFALMGTCFLISLIILCLYWKERREDRFERLQEAHRFHFDAM